MDLNLLEQTYLRENVNISGRMSKQRPFPELWEPEKSQQTHVGNSTSSKGFKEGQFLFVEPGFGSAKISDIKSFIGTFECVCEITNMPQKRFLETRLAEAFISVSWTGAI